MISKTFGRMNLRVLALSAVAVIGCGSLLARPVSADEAAPAGKGYTETIPGSEVKFEMVAIPAGKFKMGSPTTEKGHKPDEGPQFEVQVDAFAMGAKPVTWDEYNLFLQNYSRIGGAGGAGAIHVPKDKWADAVTYPTPMYELEAGPRLDRMGRPGKFPAVIMSQLAARQYTKWLSKHTGRFYRLPTEAEWEYACRAGTTTAYSFGDDPKQLENYAWFFDNSDLKGDGAYRKVGTKKPNPWGLYDMHGNVANWCIDAYDKDWYKQFEGKSVNWHDTINWPTKQYPRAIRGGSYEAEAVDCRSAARKASNKDLNDKDPQLPKSPHWLSDAFWLGFRVVSPAVEPSEAEKVKFWDVDDKYTEGVLGRDREIREIIKAPDKK
ncbi:MAG TPA: formylglycine-generating enzyme family protein [Tepidisphaeraceae bacterium]|nr:formylglycine-generating enzyme family protein [Tepidisphaeraceae bacterium]